MAEGMLQRDSCGNDRQPGTQEEDEGEGTNNRP